MSSTPTPAHSADVDHLDVLVVGAGLSGIGAGHFLQDECPWASYAIFEARDAIGGTWDLFRYPGIRSDSDMYTLGYSFRPWHGRKTIADGESILDYIRETARVEGIDAHIRYRHRVVAADWSSEDARWQVTADRTDADGDVERVTLTARFIFSCSGYYRYDRGHQPDFPGLDDFGGRVVYPQFWPEDLDVAGKNVVVIGSGATAITLVPSLAVPAPGPGAAKVTMLQRSPTYVLAVPGQNPLVHLFQKIAPARISGPIIKWVHALVTQGFFHLSRRHPNLVRRLLMGLMRLWLPRGFDVGTHFNPSYDPWDQRLCVVPDGDLFRAIRAGRVDVATDHIDTFTADGIRLQSGQHLDADVVVSATGLELLFIGGIELSVDGEAVDVADKLTYKGMMLEDVPNLTMAVGYTNASWTLKCDLTCRYVTRLLNQLRESGDRQCTPRNVDGAVSPEPLLGLQSGYIQRAADRFPKQGSRAPWRVHQSYLADYRALQGSEVTDGVMEFTNRVPTTDSASVG